MDIALIAAKILGVYMVVSGLFLIFRGKTVPHLLQDFFSHPAMLYLTGAVLIFLSTLFLLQHNVWDGTWRTIITIFGWMILAKGVAYILFPEMLHKLVTKKLLDSVNLFGLITLIAGVLLFRLG
ncbi:MAG: hypothetical protein Q7J45_03570 [bacterium]|nr:hypothetical protein [bacterium]